MEAQSLIFGFQSNSTLAPYQTPRQSTLPCPSQYNKKWGSFKPHCSANLVPQRVSIGVSNSNRVVLVACRSNDVDKLEGVSSFGDNGGAVRRKKLAVFVSGGGSNFKSIHEASVGRSVNGDVAVLVTNKPDNVYTKGLDKHARSCAASPFRVVNEPHRDCGGAEYARKNGIPVISFPKASNVPMGLTPADLVTALRNFEVDFILLAGYLKLLPVELVRAYPRSILNIHPALLPAFGGKGYYGMKVHKAVIASGARYSGATVHFVDEQYDTGRILAQRVVPVLANDTAQDLAARVLHQEHQLYVEVVSALCEERISWREDGVPLIQSKDNSDHFY